MSDNGFSQMGYRRPRPWDDDDLTTFRGKLHINDNKNSGKNEGIYLVIVSDESGREFSTKRIVGRPEPTWNEVIKIHFSSYPIGQTLKLKVVHENYYNDPGTSTGVVELVKLVGLEKRVEDLLSFEIFLTTIKIE
ncbi:hypothetical protein H5410_047306 [Solanum commersonii]|uniref:C2 domain-containing protein n=1 Tax=Solanum commersonii TaxID=4109 RepID=A0A9J5XIR9_SOLCO|nr:hypothetical protein H5410_047306 [Solanum commersonii]